MKVGRRLMHFPAWAGFAGVSAVLSVTFACLGRNSRIGAMLYIGMGIAEVLALAWGIRRYRPARAQPWYLLTVGVGLYSCANIVQFGWPVVLRNDLAFPSVADVLFVAAYMCFIIGLAEFVRSRSGRGEGYETLIDSTLVTMAAAIVVWEYFIQPIDTGPQSSTLARLVAMSYPILDLTMLAMLAMLFFTRASPSPAFWLLIGAITAQLFADASYSLALLHNTYYYGYPLTAAWLMSFGLLGAAGLHRSMRTLAEPAVGAGGRDVSWLRLVVLGAAVLTIPAVYVIRSERGDDTEVASWTTLAFLLLILRMAVFLRTLRSRNAALARTELELRSTVDRLNKTKGTLAHQVRHDALTGLPNRVLFDERLDAALLRNHTVTVMLLDVDGFKTVNDSLGHNAGDALLAAIAGRLNAALRPGDIVARLGGDEFTVLAEGLDKPSVSRIASRLLGAFDEPFQLDGRLFYGRASLGVAVSCGDEPSHELLRQADAAMYEAKRRGGQRYETFSADMHARVLDRLALEADMRQAELGSAFTVHYQPIVELVDGQLTGVEALLRWWHPERGVIPPDRFIPIAEETGFIIQLGQWVLQEACRQARTWDTRHPDLPPLGININVSARQLVDRQFADDVARVLADTGLDPVRLTLEITETMLMSNEAESIGTLRRLKELDVRIAVDDFGTGYSSLSHLELFPLDEVKIDKSFVASLGLRSGGGGVAEAAIRLARSLHVDVVAEGVEREDQLAELRRSSCGRAQGYYFWKPMDASDIDALLRQGGHTDLPPLSPTKILVVDDDATFRTSLCRFLDKAGFDTIQAAEGQTAVELSRQAHPDAVVLDVNLPDIDGLQVCHQLKEIDPTVPVVHVAGSAIGVEDRVHGLNSGADSYLTKPLLPAEVIATIRALLRAHEASAA